MSDPFDSVLGAGRGRGLSNAELLTERLQAVPWDARIIDVMTRIQEQHGEMPCELWTWLNEDWERLADGLWAVLPYALLSAEQPYDEDEVYEFVKHVFAVAACEMDRRVGLHTIVSEYELDKATNFLSLITSQIDDQGEWQGRVNVLSIEVFEDEGLTVAVSRVRAINGYIETLSTLHLRKGRWGTIE